MTLLEYVQSKNISLKTFSKGENFTRDIFSYGTLRNVSAGLITCGRKLAERIELATGGKIKRMDLLYPKTEASVSHVSDVVHGRGLREAGDR